MKTTTFANTHPCTPLPAVAVAPAVDPATLLSLSRAPGVQYLHLGPDGSATALNAGVSDVPTRRPVTAETVFNGFSITKTFTAVAVLQLVEQGKIALTDPVDRYLPEYQFSAPITVEQLLSHRAGLANPLPLSWIHLAAEDAAFDAAAFSRRIIAANTRLKSRPGAKTRYSNVGYLVLGELIERVSGMRYPDYIRANILGKLGGYGFLDFKGPDSEAYATGYHPRRSFSNLLLGLLLDKKKYTYPADARWLAFRPSYVNGAPYGGIVANAAGLSAYLRAILNHDLFEDPGTTALMFSRKEPGMGLGWFTGVLNGQVYHTHAGGGGGFYCEIRVYPALHRASVLMTNRSGFSDERLLDRVERDFIHTMQ